MRLFNIKKNILELDGLLIIQLKKNDTSFVENVSLNNNHKYY